MPVADLSDGLEPVSIPLEGAERPSFVYVAASELPDGVAHVDDAAEGCSCEGACSEDCDCIEEYGSSGTVDCG